MEQRRPAFLRTSTPCSTWNVHDPTGPHVRNCRQRALLGAPVHVAFRYPDFSASTCRLPMRFAGARLSVDSRQDPRQRIHGMRRHGRQCEHGRGAAGNRVTGSVAATTLLEHGFSTRIRPEGVDVAASGRIPGGLPLSAAIRIDPQGSDRYTPQRPSPRIRSLPASAGPGGASGLHSQRHPLRIRPFASPGTDRGLPRLAARGAMAGRGSRSICRDRTARPEHGIRRRWRSARGPARPRASSDPCHPFGSAVGACPPKVRTGEGIDCDRARHPGSRRRHAAPGRIPLAQ